MTAAVAAQRLRELFLSRRNISSEAGPSSVAGGSGEFATIVAVHVGLLVLPPLEIALGRRRQRPALAAGWLALLAGATGLRWWSIRSLGPAWNVRARVSDDLRPVTAGPYRFIRHPNYLALLIEFVALPMAGGAWISAIGLSLANGVTLARRIRSEEVLLNRSPAYRAAFAGRPRLIPGIL